MRPTDAGNRFERKRWLAWLIVAAIALVGAELVLRFTEWDIVKFAYDYRQVFRYHDRWYTDYEPATSTHIRLPADQGYILNFLVTVNQHGFRSTDLPVEHHDENRANIKYIHAIGDSFTMGWGVNYESSYPAQLDTQLSPEYAVLNLGLNGFGAIGATEKSLEVEQRFPPAYAIYLATANDYDDDHIATVYAQRPWLVHRLMDLINLLRRTTYMATVPFAVRWWIYYRDTPRWQAASLTLQPVAGHSNDAIGKASKRAIEAYAQALTDRNVPFLVVGHGNSEVVTDIVRFCKEQDIPTLHVLVPAALNLAGGDGHFNGYGNQRIADSLILFAIVVRIGFNDSTGIRFKNLLAHSQRWIHILRRINKW